MRGQESPVEVGYEERGGVGPIEEFRIEGGPINGAPDVAAWSEAEVLEAVHASHKRPRTTEAPARIGAVTIRQGAVFLDRYHQ